MPNGGKSFNTNSLVFNRKVDTKLAEKTSISGSWPTSTKAGGIRPLRSLRYDGGEGAWLGKTLARRRLCRVRSIQIAKQNSRVARVLWEIFAAM